MSTQKLALDLSDLAVESIEVAPATSMDSATYGHGIPELAASCGSGLAFSAFSCQECDVDEVGEV